MIAPAPAEPALGYAANMPDEPTKHISEALGGKFIPPMSHEEREEREDVYNLIRGVLMSYNALIGVETDSARKAELEAQRAFYTDEFRRHVGMTAEERAQVLRTYPGIMSRLDAELEK